MKTKMKRAEVLFGTRMDHQVRQRIRTWMFWRSMQMETLERRSSDDAEGGDTRKEEVHGWRT